MVKRLFITAANNYITDRSIVPVNTNKPVTIDSKIGRFGVIVFIKQFDGSIPHLSNSLYNRDDTNLLNGERAGSQANNGDVDDLSNLQMKIVFTPNFDISGKDLLFGNDTTTPVREVIPVTLLLTGLKLFTWFINKTITADIYADNPYLYGLAVNSFSYIHVGSELESEKNLTHVKTKVANQFNFTENLSSNPGNDPSLDIPNNSVGRMKYFLDPKHCQGFTFKKGVPYMLEFDTNFVKMADSSYAISIPAWGSKTFDINVDSYANEKLNNFNWVVKSGGSDLVGEGDLGLIINFALLDEEKERT
jgi:hypothetical protein